MPLSAATSAREILTGLHAIMASRGSAQSKLDKVVDLIAGKMDSDVCSIYLLRHNNLELFATHGLRKEAVHVTRLRMGEGLVGTIAAEGRVLNLAEAADHPAFLYKPETGEQRYHSFAREQIDDMAKESESGTAREHQEILEAYRMFAYDEGWSRRINAAIDSGLTAEAAIERVQQRTRARMREIDDPLLQERMHDLEDLSNRLLRIVSGRMGTAAQTGLAHDAVLVARNLGPAELLEYDRRRLKAVLLEEGSLTSHMTIVARAIGVPVIGRLHDVRHSLEEGETVLVDGDNRSRIIRPTRPLLAGFEHRMSLSQKRRAEFAAIRNLPAKTLDGLPCSIMVNAGLAEDALALPMSGAEGIGLFRTEFQFLVSATLPGRDRQTPLYTKVLEAAGNRPVAFRTV